MIDALTQLMESGQYEQSLRLAEQQLIRGGWNLSQLAQINLVICRCRLGLQDPYGAVPSGLLATKLARDTGEWDLLGRALLNVGTAYVGIRQYDQALHHFYSYFEHSFKYTTSRRLEGAIWKHIGVTLQHKLESKKAIEALNKARAWFTANDIDQSAFTVTHDLVNTYLGMHDTNAETSLAPVVDLLAFERSIVRKFPTETFYAGTHLLDRATYYMHCGRLGRAIVCAMQALEVRKGDHSLAFYAHMVLHRCTKLTGNAKQALGYALAARVEALKERRYELEFLASQAMADVIRQQGTEVVRELDEEYTAMGIDLGQYLSPSLLRRDN